MLEGETLGDLEEEPLSLLEGGVDNDGLVGIFEGCGLGSLKVVWTSLM